jgi:nitroreductase
MTIMNEALGNIYARRSVRAYSAEKVTEDKIMEIIRAGTFAPNGMNIQPLRFVVITDAALMKKYSDMCKAMAVQHFTQTLKEHPERAASLDQLIKRLSNPEHSIFYNAPSLILVFAAPSALTPLEDGALCGENMMLAAASIGIGSCWMGFAWPIGLSPATMKELAVPEDHRLVAPIIFGYPAKEPPAGRREEPKILKWL